MLGHCIGPYPTSWQISSSDPFQRQVVNGLEVGVVRIHCNVFRKRMVLGFDDIYLWL